MKPPVFILSSGRSGSTLLQRILNTYEDVTIWGEHAGLLKFNAAQFFEIRDDFSARNHLFSGENSRAGIKTLKERKHPENWQAWMNPFSRDEFVESCRQCVLNLFQTGLPDDQTWGFKEIRYGKKDRVIEFLSEIFPRARFIFLVRNGFNVVASKLRTGPPPFAAANPTFRISPTLFRRCREWKLQNTCFKNWHESGRIRSFWIRFEDLAKGEPVLDPLLKELGKTFGTEQKRVLELQKGRGSRFSEKEDINERWRALSGGSLVLADWILGDLNEALGYKPPPPLAGWSPLRRLFLSNGGFQHSIPQGGPSKESRPVPA